MKRLTYISSFSRPLAREEIEAIEHKSVLNNSKDGLTGALFCFKDLFYQILEGEDTALDRCYQRILADTRHQNIFCLNMENNIESRLYADWAMKTVILDESQDDLLRPLRNMMDSLARTYMILEKYTPEQVSTMIQGGTNPLTTKSIQAQRIVLFSDIMSSTTLTEILAPDVMSELLSHYYNIANYEIKRAGGTISKLTGDGLMAYFDIEKADKCLEASAVILSRLNDLRLTRENTPLALLYAGIGISAGPVLEGSIGSNERKDYTLLGDAVNSAARLESATRKTKKALLFDTRFFNLLKTTSQVTEVGRFHPKGKQELLDIYTLGNASVSLPMDSETLREKILKFAA